MALIQRNTAYSLDDIVNTKYGIKLKCTTAGTTSTDPLILDGTSPITDGTVVWEVQEEGGGGQGLVDYVPNTSYNVGDIVIYDNKIYKCITAHTSTSIFDDTKWEEISASDSAKQAYQSVDTLWSNPSNTKVKVGDTLTLSKPYTDYDYIYIQKANDGFDAQLFLPSNIGVTHCLNAASGMDYYNIAFTATSSTQLTVSYLESPSSSVGTLKLIQGIKLLPTSGLYVNRDVLFSGNLTIEENAIVNLTNPYTDYDYLLLEKTASGYDAIIAEKDEILTRTFVFTSIFIDKQTYFLFNALSTTQLKLVDVINTAGSALYRITGIKFLPNPNNYSTTEKEIGTWIDGKKLYQRTISYSIPTGSGLQKLVIETLSNVDNVVEIFGASVSGVPVNAPEQTTFAYSITCWFEPTTKELTMTHHNDGGDVANITIRYTKT